MSKIGKLGPSASRDPMTDAVRQTLAKLVPAIETDAMRSAREMERRLNPLAGIESGPIARTIDVHRTLDSRALSSLHRSMADHLRVSEGAEALKTQLAAMDAMKPAFDAMKAIRPVLDATRPISEAMRASAALYDLHCLFDARSGLRGLDLLRSGVLGTVGESHALASLDAFARVRDRIGGSLGLDVAAQWDRLAAATALPTVAALSFPFARATSVMTLGATDEVLGTLAWLAPALDPEGEEPPRVVVAALHSRKPSDRQPWRELRIATGAAINCRKCGEPLDSNLKLWLTGEDLEVFFQGEMLPICSSCGGGSPLDLPMVASYRVIDGGGEGDEVAIGKLSLVVDSERDEHEDD